MDASFVKGAGLHPVPQDPLWEEGSSVWKEYVKFSFRHFAFEIMAR